MCVKRQNADEISYEIQQKTIYSISYLMLTLSVIKFSTPFLFKNSIWALYDQAKTVL